MNEFQQLVIKIKQLEDKNIKSAEFDIQFLKRALSYAVINPKSQFGNSVKVDGGSFSD